MYKCQICNAQSKPGQLLLRHAVMRTIPHLRRASDGRPVQDVREEIARELAVCPDCLLALTAGKTLDELMRDFAEGRPTPFVPAEPPPQPKVNVPVFLGGRSATRENLVNTFRR